MNEINVSTKDRPGDYDAIETAKPGEPLFPVQGGDPLGPRTVQFWADFARATARALLVGARVRVGETALELVDAPHGYRPSEANEREAERLLRKATGAELVGWAMLAYQRGETEVTGKRVPCSDPGAEPLAADAGDRVAQRKALIAMNGHLNNSLAISDEVAGTLREMRIHPEALAMISTAVELLRAAAAEIEPRRGNERS